MTISPVAPLGACALTLAVLVLPAEARAQATADIDLEAVTRPELRVLPRSAQVSIDGRLDEAVWQDIQPITRFIQAEPNAGAPASEDTEVRIFYDEDRLYIGAELYDRDPSGIIVRSIERDSPGILFEEMDALGIALDTFLDRRSSFLFFVNAMGGLKDGQGFDNGRSRDYGWDAIVDVKTTIHENGWTLEMSIPWKTLRFDPTLPDQEWGLNLMRRVRRRNEVSYWAPLDRRNRIFLMAEAGTMTGLGQLPAGRNLWVKPFALTSRSTGEAVAADRLGGEFDGGLDVKWGITPSLTMDLTYRTDFSQVEVDREQVNLTRFPLFFPEQRDFFLENSGTFTFGDVNGGPGAPRSGTSLRDFTLFHSREIGLTGGTPVPLLGGARLTGRMGPLEVGALNVQTEAFDGDPAENMTVMRVRGSLGGQSDIGAMLTNRQSTGVPVGGYSRAGGVDANLRFFGGLFINTYAAATSSDDASDEAARLAVGWRDRFWNIAAAARHVGADFDPGLGFVRRTGIRDMYASVGIHPRPASPRIAEVNPYLEATRVTDLNGLLQTRLLRGTVRVSFNDRSSLSFGVTNRFERLDREFNVRPGTTIPAADYTWTEGSARYSTSQGKTLSGTASLSGGGYFGGSRFTVSGSTRWQPSAQFTFQAAATHNGLTVQGNDFSADLYSVRIKYAHSTQLNFGAFVQYNADREELVTNLRANLIHAPLSDLFLLLTERRSTDGDAVLERFVTLKATRLLAF